MDERRGEITAKVFSLAAEHGGVEVGAITSETHFINDLHFDSLQMVEFTMDLEDELEMTVPDEDAVQLLTVGSVVDYVMAHPAEAPKTTA